VVIEFKSRHGFKLAGLLIVMAMTGCAGSAAQEKTQEYDSAPAPVAKPAVAAGDCFENAATLKSMKESCKIDSSGYSELSLNGRRMTVAQMVRATGKKVAIFQLAGVTCVTCVDESREFERKIAASSVGSQIAHIILFTDRRADYLEEDFTRFMSSNSVNGIRAHDEDGKLWRALQPQKDVREPGRSPVFAADVDGNGAFINLSGRLLDIFAAAERLAKSSTAAANSR